MRVALDLARCGLGRTAPNPAVGAVIVRDGIIVGRGYHHGAGLPHAEIEALAEAGAMARGATMYVTLEPCNHHGRTGPCTHAVLAAGISRLVYAVADPFEPAAGGAAWLSERGVLVSSGVLAREARELNAPFFTGVLKGRPLVLLKLAGTLDGHPAERSGKSKYITGSKALERVHQMRNTLDAIMIGAGTARLDDPSLTCRLAEDGRDPLRVLVVSSPGEWLLDLQLTTTLARGTILFTATGLDPELRATLRDRGLELIEGPTPPGAPIAPAFVLDRLFARGIRSILLEGGPTLATAFLEAGLVDQIALFLAPKLLLDSQAPLLMGSRRTGSLDRGPTIAGMSVEMVGQDVLVTGTVEYPEEWP